MCVRVTRDEHLERGSWRHDHDALVVRVGQTDGAPDRAREGAGIGDPGIAAVEGDLDHVVGQRIDGRRAQRPWRRGTDSHMVGWHKASASDDGAGLLCGGLPGRATVPADSQRCLTGGEDEVCRAQRPNQLASRGREPSRTRE